MATLDYDEVKPRVTIIYDGQPHEVLESHVARTQQRKPQNQVKLRNLISGRVIPATFHATERAEEAEISKGEAKFLYASKGEFWFCNPTKPSERFKIGEDILGDASKFLKTDTIVETKIYGEDEDAQIIGVRLPVKVTLKVTEAPPAVKGNTASGGDKLVTLETGAKVTTPLFINEGDMVIINTETGEYVERAKE